MCMRNAENKNQGSLPYKFWNVKPWDWTFKRQLIAANKLLRTYTDTVLVKSINSQEFYGIFSLNNPKVVGILKKYKLIEDAAKEKPVQVVEVKDNPVSRRSSFGKKSQFNILRKLEGGDGEKTSEG